MEQKTKYLNDLARRLDDLAAAMVESGLPTMSKVEIDRLLANICDYYTYMEKGLDVIASILESKDGVSH